jgi:hypothetical protein
MSQGPTPPSKEFYRQQILQSIGGWQGALITAIPTVVFVLVNVIAGLGAAVISALAVAALLVLYRLARKQPTQQAFSGAFGVGIAALIAAWTGHAKGFFLYGIWTSFAYAAPLGISVLLRRPLIGVVWEYLDPTPGEDDTPWHKRPPLLRAYAWSTLLWTALLLSRGGVQLALYHRDATGWLAFARIAMGYPLTILAAGATFWLVTRARKQLKPALAAGDDGAA